MTRSPNHAALYEAIEQFQEEVKRLALGAVRTVLGEELDRKRAKRKPARRRAVSARGGAAASTAAPAKREPAAPPSMPEAAADADADAAATMAGGPPAQGAPETPPADGAPEAAPTTQGDGRKRGPWTRDSIVSELATWMLSGTAIDAAFVTRYGPPGLVAAARRLFGRFDAALNVAALHISKLYPDGPPKPGTPGAIAPAGGRRPSGWTAPAAQRRERRR
jgi:hypothetical protein